MFSGNDRDVLRRLAGKVAELAARPVEEEKRDLWYRHNALEPTRPVIFCDPENGWNEIIPSESLECENESAREWEFHLRREVFRGEEMLDDRVINPYFPVGYVFTQSDWGMHETRTGGEHGGSFVWDAPLKSYQDFDKLHFPRITVDYQATEGQVNLANEIIGDLLPVQLKGFWWWSLGMTQTLVNLRGMEQVMFDMIDCPEDLHRLMAFLRDGTLAKLDFLEENNLLSPNTEGDYVGSGGFGWTRELPRADFNGRVRTRDIWGFCESQETVSVSPDMFDEFIFTYQLPILERFGLNCYGCCEPLDTRWSVIERAPNLRRVSVSPWSNIREMAEKLGDRYIFSLKPTPSDLAMPTFSEDLVRGRLREAFESTRNCRVEAVMKDCHTICRDPSRAVRWARIAREEADRL